MAAEPVIDVRDLTYTYPKAAAAAVASVSFSIDPGEVFGFLGPNGAGKTTTLNTIFGLATIHSGRVLYKGKDITKVPAHQRAKMGMAYTLQLFNIFATLTVKENLLLATYDLPEDEAKKRMEEVFQLFPRLKERLFQKAGTLSGGERQMLAISISLLRKPELMLLDEPTAGLAPKLAKEVFNAIRQLGDQGYTIVLAEQNAKGALEIGDEAVLIASGRIVAKGKASELLERKDLARMYLGLA
jgi:branched-chain amino acid transport system ATP-binding protein